MPRPYQRLNHGPLMSLLKKYVQYGLCFECVEERYKRPKRGSGQKKCTNKTHTQFYHKIWWDMYLERKEKQKKKYKY